MADAVSFIKRIIQRLQLTEAVQPWFDSLSQVDSELLREDEQGRDFIALAGHWLPIQDVDSYLECMKELRSAVEFLRAEMEGDLFYCNHQLKLARMYVGMHTRSLTQHVCSTRSAVYHA